MYAPTPAASSIAVSLHLHLRLDFIYTPRHHFRQLQQVLDARDGSATGLFDKGIRGARVRPGRRKQGPAPRFAKIINPPLTPLPLAFDQFKPPTPPGMKRMGYREISQGLLATGCSPRATPNRDGIPPSSACAWLGARPFKSPPIRLLPIRLFFGVRKGQ